MKNFIKVLFIVLGNVIFIDAIITEVDGIGRFAMILFGLIFSLTGAFMSFKKKDK